MKSRSWFAPGEGLAGMRWPIDYAVAAVLGAVSFALSFVNYWWPRGKLFDEIYFARAAEEYLTHRGIYETTHPPLSKLLITLSVMLFGGMHGGDNSVGWRFLNVVFGALLVVVLYAFAKRVTGSTFFAAFAAGLLICDGMHFVESRIATPEGLVVVFSTMTLYAFYRYWLASQSTVRAYEQRAARDAAVTAITALALGLALSAALCVPTQQTTAALIVLGVYFATAIHLLVRLAILPRLMPSRERFVSYPEGSFAAFGGDRVVVETFDGGVLDSARKTPVIGTQTRRVGDGLVARDGGIVLRYGRDGGLRYETPEGAATYAPGVIRTERDVVQRGDHAAVWLVVTAIFLGLLVASKWYGVMTYGVAFVVIGLVWLQRYLERADGRMTVWGNPFGFRLDVSLATIVFVSATMYMLAWLPDYARHVEYRNLSDIVYRQYFMFHYHDTLTATHPYASPWWQWPFDLRPILYYADWGKNPRAPVHLIYALPNPLILWAGLFAVPATAYLAWTKRNKGYALLIVAYLLLWLPWSRSPRIAWEYHFYVVIPLICLCNAILLQRVWHWAQTRRERRIFAGSVIALCGLAAVGSFAFFYPMWSGAGMSRAYYSAHVWLPSWV